MVNQERQVIGKNQILLLLDVVLGSSQGYKEGQGHMPHRGQARARQCWAVSVAGIKCSGNASCLFSASTPCPDGAQALLVELSDPLRVG